MDRDKVIPDGSEALSTADGANNSGSGSDDWPIRAAYTDPVVAEKEQKAVFWSKFLALVVLSSAVIAVATSTYFFISNGEMNNFKTQVRTNWKIHTKYSTCLIDSY